MDEIHLPTLLAGRPDYLDTLLPQSIIILCANPARQAVLSQDIKSRRVALISKPFGPYRLARTICRALETLYAPIEDKELKQKHEQTVVMIPDSSSSAVSSATRNPGITRRKHEVHAGSQGEHLASQTPPARAVSTYVHETHFREVATVRSASHIHEVEAGTGGGFPFPVHDVQPNRSTPPPNLPGDDPKTPETRPAQHLAPPGARRLGVLESRPAATPTDPQPPTTVNRINLWNRQPGAQSRKPRLLLVDDNRLNLQLLHTYLLKKGHDSALIRTAEDGRQALDIYREFLADIVFMDLSMPVMDGLEATREIRAFEARRAVDTTPTNPGESRTCAPAVIIALTGNAKSNDQTEAFNCGIDMYMTKPVSLKQIGVLLENWRERT